MNLEHTIEALLFWKSEPMTITQLSKICSQSPDAITNALESLQHTLSNRGIRLVRKEDSVLLVTAPDTSELIETLTKEDLSKELGKAGLETLTLIAYRGPIARSEVDYIRGVNSQFIIRHLLMRGLIEKITDPQDERRFLYKVSFDLLNYLGIQSIEELPEFQQIQAEIDAFKKDHNEQRTEPTGSTTSTSS